MNSYLEIKNAFQYLDCAVRNNDCTAPKRLLGGGSDLVLKDYILCLTLVSLVSQLEYDIKTISGVPNLRTTTNLKPRLRALKEHFSIPDTVFNAVDLIREARNKFVHDRQLNANLGFTKAELPGKIVSFLQYCKHADYA